MATDNKTLGRFMLTDIPPAPRGVPQIEVTFDIDANGIINVSARDKGTGKEQNIRIESGNKLSDDEIKKMKDDAAANEKADQERLKVSQLKNEADGIIFQAEKMSKDLEEKITEEEKSSLESLIKDLKEKKDSSDPEQIEGSIKPLVEKLQEISTRVYSQSQENSSEGAKAEADREVEEVDFEEVKS